MRFDHVPSPCCQRICRAHNLRFEILASLLKINFLKQGTLGATVVRLGPKRFNIFPRILL